MGWSLLAFLVLMAIALERLLATLPWMLTQLVQWPQWVGWGFAVLLVIWILGDD